MALKVLVIAVLLAIIYCLGSGLYYLVREGVGSHRLVVALTWRVALSVCLFIFIIIAYFLGWIHPHML